MIMCAAGDAGRHDGAHADRAAAEYGDARAELRLQRVQHRARAGLDTAAHGRHDGQVDVVIGHLHRALGGDDGVLREGGLAEEHGQRLTVLGQAGGAVGQRAAEVDLVEPQAGGGLAGIAVFAGVAVQQ